MDLALTEDEAAFAAEARDWLAGNVEAPPAFETAEAEIEWGRAWQARLAAGRWVGIQWPEAYGGRSATPVEVALFNVEFARARAAQPVNRVGINLAGPTLLAHGTDDQRQRWLPSILDASELWCQLFSEPDAGSDLGALRTAAEAAPDGDGWRLSGQKVWTSYAQFARWGICLARAEEGISFFVLDMTAPGIEIRPLTQITGEAEFNEVFLDGVPVPADQLIGPLGGGWDVARTTLAHERGTAFPFKEQVVHETFLSDLWAEAGEVSDVDLRDRLARAWIELRLLRLHNWRTLTRLGRGEEPGPESSLVKLAWTDMTQHLSSVAVDMKGAGAPLADAWSRQWLWSKAASIAGGTSEIQKTILAERILGLPRGLTRET